jgi:hypothetical protein
VNKEPMRGLPSDIHNSLFLILRFRALERINKSLVAICCSMGILPMIPHRTPHCRNGQDAHSTFAEIVLVNLL